MRQVHIKMNQLQIGKDVRVELQIPSCHHNDLTTLRWANTKMIQQLTEFGQNLPATGPNELAIANVIALVITEL